MDWRAARLSRGSAIWVAIGTMGAAGFSFLFQGYLSLMLTDGDFGAISSAIVTAVAFAFFSSVGAQNVMLDLVKKRSMKSHVVLFRFMNIWFIIYVLAILTCIFSFILYGRYSYEYIFVASLVVLLSLCTILGSERQSVDDFRGVCVYLIAPEFGKLLALGVAAYLGTRELGGAYLTLGLVFTGLATIALLSPLPWHGWRLQPPYLELITVGFPYAASGLLFMVYYRATLVIFSHYGLLDAAGSLAIIYLFMTAILLVPTAYSQRYLLGRWHAIRRDDTILFKAELHRQIKSILMFSVPIGILWLLLSQSTLDLIYGERYPLARAHAHWFAIIFVIRSICIPLQAATSVNEMRWGKTWVVLAAAMTTLGLSVALAAPLGLVGALISGICAELVVCFGLAFLIWRHLRADQRLDALT